ncbi:MAG: GNAT family N-acetyltransferase [Alphaproteobacteria bacterium]|nr:MAG: GNAT family N-acetyltransferase [Alphaproteobacteria bacterium]
MTDPKVWHQVLAGVDRLPLQQSWSYGAALAGQGLGARRVILSVEERPVGAAQIIIRKIVGPIRLVSVIRGPVWFDGATGEDQTRALKALRHDYRRRSGDFLFVTPEGGSLAETNRLFRSMGARSVLTGSSTVWVDLRPCPENLMANLDGKWRNRLRKAQQQPSLRVAVRRARERDLLWITDLEERQAAARRYRGLPARVIHAYWEEAPEDVMFGVARQGGNAIAAALFLRHGQSATYQIGWADIQGRRMDAQRRLMWEAILALRAQGVRTLDLGGIDTVNAPGVARFKLGLGGEVVRGPGTYF